MSSRGSSCVLRSLRFSDDTVTLREWKLTGLSRRAFSALAEQRGAIKDIAMWSRVER